jgi:hypothetical protein
VTETETGHVVLACGANQTSGGLGFLYVVDSQPLQFTNAPTRYTPVLRWIEPLQYAANPGVSLDRNATRVTATDGKPKASPPGAAPAHAVAGATPESPGNFYLFDAAAGALLWKYPTPIMNWPMVITPDGSAQLGGSDDGTLYRW